MKDHKIIGSLRSLCITAVVFLGVIIGNAQSTSQDYPTPATSNEISGSIKARDVGDARLTAYYYAFEGGQGDLFLNLVTRNFTGDIDVFVQPGIRPLTKIVVYADLAEIETGRVLYLRKPEKLLLRVQGRSPNDNPAEFRIKFAGSFVAASDTGPVEPEMPKVTAANTSGIRVNSVGTILEVLPKPTPAPSEVIAEIEEGKNPDIDDKKPPEEAVAKETVAESAAKVSDPEKKLEVVVTDELPKETATPVKSPPARRTTRASRLRNARAAAAAKAREKAALAKEKAAAETASPTDVPDPLASIQLVILFKDGKTIAQPMSEVLRFNVNRGILTVTMKNGSTGKYSILDVAKVTIE